MSAFTTSHINAKVQQALFRRMLAINRKVPNGEVGVGSLANLANSLNNSSVFVPRDIQDDGTNPYEQSIVRSVYCKVSTEVADAEGDLIHLASYIYGGLGTNAKGESTQANRPISFKNQITPDSTSYRGDSGITAVSVSQKSYFLNEVTINWTCPDPMDFEKRIQPIFLKHGRIIFVEFGFGVSEKEFKSFGKVDTSSIKNIMESQTNYNLEFPEKYQVFVGQVTKFNFELTDYGGYTGTITLASRGKNVLETPIPKQDASTKTIKEINKRSLAINQLKEQEKKERDTLLEGSDLDDDEKKAIKTENQKKFANKVTSFKAVIQNLENVVENYLSETTQESKKINELLSDEEKEKIRQGDSSVLYGGQGGSVIDNKLIKTELKYKYKNGAMHYQVGQGYDVNPDDDPWVGPIATKALNQIKEDGGTVFGSNKTGWQRLAAAFSATVNLIDLNLRGSFETLYMVGKKTTKIIGEKIFEAPLNDKQDKSQFLVSWGWFEDHILNSFFQIEAKTNELGNITLQQIRSVHQPYKYEVLQFEKNQDLAKRSDEISQESAKAYAETYETERGVKDEFEKRLAYSKAYDADQMSIVDLKDENGNKIYYNNRMLNSPSLQSTGFDSVVLPGQNSTMFEEQEPDDSSQNEKQNNNTESANQRLQEGTSTDSTRVSSVGSIKRKSRIEQACVIALYDVIDSGNTFPKFAVDDTKQDGYIRNLVFDVKYLKESFTDITSVKDGLRDFWSKVKTDLFDYNKFQITVDANDDGRIGITDANYLSPSEKSVDLLSSEKKSEDEDINDEKKLQDKMFHFSVYSPYSIVRSYSLDLQLTDKAATLAAIGGGIGSSDDEPLYHYDVGIDTLSTFARIADAKVGDEKNDDTIKRLKDENRKINDFTITGLETLYNGSGSLGSGYGDLSSKEVGVVEPNGGIDFQLARGVANTITEINEEIKKKQKDENGEKDNVEDDGTTFLYDDKGRLKTRYRDKYASRFNKSEGINPKQEGLYNNMKVIIPIELSITLDGIGGLRVGNMFRTDYLPAIYRDYCYFVITSVGHTINAGQWTTDIKAIMKADRPRMIEDGLLRKRGEENPTILSDEEREQRAIQANRETYLNKKGEIVKIDTKKKDNSIAPDKDNTVPNTVDQEDQPKKDLPASTPKNGTKYTLKDGTEIRKGDEGFEQADAEAKKYKASQTRMTTFTSNDGTTYGYR